MLTKKQFQVLAYLAKKTEPQLQKNIAAELGMSLGSVNTQLSQLSDEGLVFKGVITDAGREALEPYRVKRAILMAAGFGARMVPITINTPKPLVRVRGKRIIETLLDALVAAGIEEIFIVRGYLGEQFNQLLVKYPMLHFIENPLYNEANNISSIVCVGNLIKNAYIMEADLYLKNPDLITTYQYSSNYLAISTPRTDDWCFHLKGGYISKVAVGGYDCYQTVGISYWTDEDGERLTDHIRAVFNEPGGKERSWGTVPLVYYADQYKVSIRECTFDDVMEIDTYNELKKADPLYDV